MFNIPPLYNIAGYAFLIITVFLLISLNKNKSLQIEALQTQLSARQAYAQACDENLEKNRKVSDKYQKQIHSIDRELANYKRVFHDTASGGLQRETASSNYATTATTQPLGRDGLLVRDLLEFGAKAERVRKNLIACQNFIKD